MGLVRSGWNRTLLVSLGKARDKQSSDPVSLVGYKDLSLSPSII